MEKEKIVFSFFDFKEREVERSARFGIDASNHQVKVFLA
jgi:hypothetical protein